jgi:hypothetical protein
MFGPRFLLNRPDARDRAGIVSRIAQSHASECGSAANVAAGGYFGQEKVKKLARH